MILAGLCKHGSESSVSIQEIAERRTVEKAQVSLKSGRNNGQFT